MRSTRPTVVFLILACLSLAACRTAPPAAPEPRPGTAPDHPLKATMLPKEPAEPIAQSSSLAAPAEEPREIHYGFLFSGNRAGSAASRVEP
ncbi:MAG TPA: hypothetical protein VIJ61_15990, partial [Thermoanaerobaculia bacterium]